MQYGHQLYQATLSLHQGKKVYQIVYAFFITSMRPPGDEISRFLPKIWMSLALLQFTSERVKGVFWAVGCRGSNFKMLLQVSVLALLPFYILLPSF